MPLPPPIAARQRLHERRVTYEGFERDDGLFDIDAHLADIKDHDFLLLTGNRAAGDPDHSAICRRPPCKRLPGCDARTMAHRSRFSSTVVTHWKLPRKPFARSTRS